MICLFMSCFNFHHCSGF
jgi:hypothetical protein